MITGRNRSAAASIISPATSTASFNRRLAKVTNTNPFKTEIPDSAINPTAAEIENGIPLNHRASMPHG